METVFDLATSEELVALLGEDDPDLPDRLRGYADERQLVTQDADYNLGLLASLFAMRGDVRRADGFVARIQDDQRRLDSQLFLHELTA